MTDVFPDWNREPTGILYRALIMTAEPQLSELVSNALAQEGVEVVTLLPDPTRPDPLDNLRPDLVVLDAAQSDTDSFATCTRMRSMPSLVDVPVVMLVNGEDISAVDRAIAVGADDVLVMPLHPSILRLRARLMLQTRGPRDALRRREALYQLMVDTAHEGIWLLGRDSRTVYVNQRMAYLLGYTVEEMLGRTLLEFMDDDQQADAKRLLERRWQGIPEHHAFTFRRADGTFIETLVTANLLVAPDGTLLGALGMVTDMTDLKQTEAALQASEARFRSTFDQAAIGMAVVALDSTVLEVNHALCRLTGYTANELVGQNVEQYIHPDDREVDRAEANHLREGARDQYQTEKRYLCRNGDVRWAMINMALVRDNSGGPHYVVSQIQDITERKQAEERLQQSQARLVEAERVAQLGTWTWDMATDTHQWSDGLYHIFGLARDTFTPTLTTLNERIHPEDRPALERAQRRVMEEHQPLHNEHRIVRPDGTVRVIMARGAWVADTQSPQGYVIGSAQDITEHALAQVTLRQSEARFAAIFHASPVAITLIGVSDGRFIDVNRSFVESVGYTREEVLGRTIADQELWAETEAWDHLAALLRQHGRVQNHEVKLRTKDGMIRDFLYAVERIELAGEACLLAYGQDITERKRAEAALARTNEHLTNTLESISDAFFALDHTWRFTYLNHHAETLLRRPRSHILGRNAWDEFPDAVGSPFEQGYREAVALQMPVTFEAWYEPLATWFEVHAYPTPDGLAVYFRDVSARRAIAQALHLRERAIDAVSNGIIITDVQHPDHPIIYCNPAFERLTGYTATEVLGRNCRFLQGRDTDRAVVSVIRAALQDERACQVELLNYRRDGTSFWNELTISPVRDNAGRVVNFIGVQTDITARKQAEQALRESQQFTQQIMETFPGLVYVYDLVERRNVYANRQVGQLLGYTAAEVQAMGNTFLPTVIHPDDWPVAVATRENLARDSTGQTYEHAIRVLHRDGTIRWLDDRSTVFKRAPDGQVLQTLGYAQDSTLRREAEVQLAQSQAQLAGIIDTAMDAIITVDRDARVRLFNRAAERMFGVRATEIVGQSFELIPQELTMAGWQRDHADDDTSHTSAFHAQRADGTRFPIEISRSHIDIAGEILVTIIVRDVTERQRLEAQLQQAQKMESVGQLAGGIAHDFNNLLTGILGYANLALMSLPPDSPIHDDLQEINQAGERAAALTQQLLAFARKQKMETQVIDLNSLLLNLGNLLRRVLNESIDLVVEVAETAQPATIDPGQIEQVLVNLAVNARDAMPDGGTLTIQTQQVVLDAIAAQQYLGLRPGAYVRLVVTDTGTGMTDIVKAHMFEPFFTTKETGKGTGLGLATCYGIVKQHGGTITCYSELGQGTTFMVYLPLAVDPNTEQRAEDLAQTARRGQETILLVEDEVGVRGLVSRVLRRYGYTVLEATNGTDAMARLEEHPNLPIHLVLTDMIMPQVGGRAVAEYVRATRPSVPVVFMSGYTDTALSHDGRLEGGVAFLQKPFAPQVLLQKVREVLDQLLPPVDPLDARR